MIVLLCSLVLWEQGAEPTNTSLRISFPDLLGLFSGSSGGFGSLVMQELWRMCARNSSSSLQVHLEAFGVLDFRPFSNVGSLGAFCGVCDGCRRGSGYSAGPLGWRMAVPGGTWGPVA